jgi:hypothetical protein
MDDKKYAEKMHGLFEKFKQSFSIKGDAECTGCKFRFKNGIPFEVRIGLGHIKKPPGDVIKIPVMHLCEKCSRLGRRDFDGL